MLERGAAAPLRHAWFAPRMMAAPWWLLQGARKCVPGPWRDSSAAPRAVVFGLMSRLASVSSSPL